MTTPPDIVDFIYALFDEGELGCLSRDAYGTAISSPFTFNSTTPPSFVVINPMHTSRADANVTARRNFLVEFDNMPLDEQMPFVESLKLPWSTATFSGNKSIHFVICLEEPLDEFVYKHVTKWMYNILGDQVDKQNCNPSRFTRWPGGPNVKMVKGELTTIGHSKLLEVRGRVKNADFEAWLLAHMDARPYERQNHTTDKAFKRRSDPIDHEVAVSYLNDKHPLLRGEKQPNLLIWAIYLLANTNMDKDAMVDALADNDLGNHRKVSEYERAVDRAFEKLEANS